MLHGFSLHVLRMVFALTNGQRLAGAICLLQKNADDFTQMKWNSFWSHLRTINNQDVRCHPTAALEGLLLRSGVSLVCVQYIVRDCTQCVAFNI